MKTLAIVGRTDIIYKDRFHYCGHPNIAILDNGEWLVGFGYAPRRERITHHEPLTRGFLTRTSDQGATWEEPYVVPDFNWPGNRGMPSQLSNGTVVLLAGRLNWYPLGLARKRRAAGEPISISLPGRGWVKDFTDDDWGRSEFSWAFGESSLYVHISTDRGHTFEDTIKVDTSPFAGHNRVGVVELRDGRVACFGYDGDPHSRVIYILFSSTGGQSWDPPVIITDLVLAEPDIPLAFSEPDIAEVAPGELYCILREEKRRYLYGCRSLDGGHSWSVPEATPIFGLPGHLLVLQDGRLLCTYGRRIAPFGIRACLSEDGGRTWEIDQEIVIRDDLPNSDLGYPVTIEYAPGQLFICYYGQDFDGVTCIQGSHVTLK